MANSFRICAKPDTNKNYSIDWAWRPEQRHREDFFNPPQMHRTYNEEENIKCIPQTRLGASLRNMVETPRLDAKKRIAEPMQGNEFRLLRPFRHARQARQSFEC
jgi:hypothetical protein